LQLLLLLLLLLLQLRLLLPPLLQQLTQLLLQPPVLLRLRLRLGIGIDPAVVPSSPPFLMLPVWGMWVWVGSSGSVLDDRSSINQSITPTHRL
jgi:hypothetical protein